MNSTTYERFPLPTVLLSNGLAAAIYAIGVYVFLGLGLWFVVAYAVYCLCAPHQTIKLQPFATSPWYNLPQ